MGKRLSMTYFSKKSQVQWLLQTMFETFSVVIDGSGISLDKSHKNSKTLTKTLKSNFNFSNEIATLNICLHSLSLEDNIKAVILQCLQVVSSNYYFASTERRTISSYVP